MFSLFKISIFYYKYFISIIRNTELFLMGIGDWGLGIGDWGLGPIPNPQSPIPNPQSPIPNPQSPIPNRINYILKSFI